MKKNLKEIIILIIQLYMFYVFPHFCGPTDAMGMVIIILLSTFILSLILGCISKFKLKFGYAFLIALLFIPSVFIYYNSSALVHSLWYLIASFIGVILGTSLLKLTGNIKKEILVTIVVILCLGISILFLSVINKTTTSNDTLKYNEKIYVLLDFNHDVFTYNYIAKGYFEVDEISPVNDDKWDIVYFDGDIFIEAGAAKDAIEYYANDNNYNWYLEFEENDKIKKYPVFLSENEISYIYQINEQPRKKTIRFEDIYQFANIVKESKDSKVKAHINLVYTYDYWYWKSEVMNDNDEEYIIPLPETLNEKINNVSLKEL